MNQTLALRIPEPRVLGALVAGGIAADLAWEVWARVVTPVFVGGPLQPAALILSLFRLPGDYYPHAEVLHLMTGALFYPLIMWAIRAYIYRGGRVVDGIIIGLFTWFLALGVFAPLAGLPFMLGFIKLAWFSGIGHLAYGLVLSFVFHALARER
jgi:hypothetical protein